MAHAQVYAAVDKEVDQKAQNKPAEFTRRAVGVKTKVLIEEVDVVKEVTQLKIFICFHYKDPSIEPWDKPEPPSNIFKPCPESVRDVFVNFIDANTIEKLETFRLCHQVSGTIFQLTTYRVCVREIFELKRFPFDRQVFKLSMYTFGAKFEKWSSPELETPFRVRNDPMMMKADNAIYYDMEAWRLDWLESHTYDKERQCMYEISSGCSRTSAYYLNNFALVIFIIVEVGSFTIAIDPSDFSSRSSLAVTLLLTLVAFRFVMATMLPTINYQTWMDMYCNSSIIMLGLVLVENVAVSSLFFPIDSNTVDDATQQPLLYSTPRQVDYIFFVVFNALWLCLHVVVVLGAKWEWFYESWELVKAHDRDSMKTVQYRICDTNPYNPHINH